jgi:hypothetical protein
MNFVILIFAVGRSFPDYYVVPGHCAADALLKLIAQEDLPPFTKIEIYPRA